MMLKLVTALALVASALGGVVQINTPVPMLPGAWPRCEGFFLASPGVTCASMAAEHGLSLDDFLKYNPQIIQAGGCEGGGVVPHYWYCVKNFRAPPGALPGQQGPKCDRQCWQTLGRQANVGLPTTPATPTPTTSTTVTRTSTSTTLTTRTQAPATTQPPKCEVDNCFRGFLRIVPQVTKTHSQFCSKLLKGPCTASHMSQLKAPAVINDSCPKERPCSAVSSACACYLNGAMEGHIGTRGPNAWD